MRNTAFQPLNHLLKQSELLYTISPTEINLNLNIKSNINQEYLCSGLHDDQAAVEWFSGVSITTRNIKTLINLLEIRPSTTIARQTGRVTVYVMYAYLRIAVRVCCFGYILL